MKAFPWEITKIPQLTILELSRNNFSTLPLDVKNMTKLTKLNLNENKYVNYPITIYLS